MDIPQGYISNAPKSHVCKLKKVIYGLKQSPRAWYSKLHNALKSQNFSVSNTDHSLFIKHSNHVIIVIIIYVGDIILTRNDSIGIEHAKFI